jgi:intergrase/recombinase
MSKLPKDTEGERERDRLRSEWLEPTSTGRKFKELRREKVQAVESMRRQGLAERERAERAEQLNKAFRDLLESMMDAGMIRGEWAKKLRSLLSEVGA